MSSLRNATASDYFGSMVEAYDSLMERAVPRYLEMTERLLVYLPESAARVLELGCGTGNLSLRLAAKYPNAEFTFVDASSEMLDVARARLRQQHPEAAGRAELRAVKFEELRSGEGSFDAITSCISLHHVRDKAALFSVLREMLAPGGMFAFADQMAGATSRNSEINWSRWLEFCRQPGHCTETEIQSLIEHAEAHDHYVSVPDHLRLLREAGFRQVDCVWRNRMWGIVTAEM